MDGIATASITICGVLYVVIGYSGYATFGTKVSRSVGRSVVRSGSRSVGRSGGWAGGRAVGRRPW